MIKGFVKGLRTKKGMLICTIFLTGAIITVILVKNEFKSSASESKSAEWNVGKTYSAGDVIEKDGAKYKCLIGHTVYNENWKPSQTPSLWEEISKSSSSDNNIDKKTNDETDKASNENSNSKTNNDNKKVTKKTNIRKANNSFGTKIFSPYADMSMYVDGGHFDLAKCAKQTNQKCFTMAFILDSNGQPAWGGSELVEDGKDDAYKERINELRKLGGDVMVSFGGANGVELAQGINDVDKLTDAYQKVIDRYDLKWIDLDIEGAAVSDKASIDRRNKAIRKIQEKNKDLTVAYCLPALPTGLTEDGLNVIKNAKENGVRVDVVNIMAMDYGDGAAPSPSGKMADYAIKAAENTHKQINSEGVDSKIGVTPMIGRNDVRTEVFTLNDAEKLKNWANSKDFVRLLSMWSVTRDNKGEDSEDVACNKSSVKQEQYGFINKFKGFNK